MAAKKKTEAANRFPKATEKDFTVIVKPLITEKTMALMQNENKVTVKVLDSANKTEIKLAFERIFQVKVTDVKVLNQRAKFLTKEQKKQPEAPDTLVASLDSRKPLLPSLKAKQSTYSKNKAVHLFKL